MPRGVRDPSGWDEKGTRDSTSDRSREACGRVGAPGGRGLPALKAVKHSQRGAAVEPCELSWGFFLFLFFNLLSRLGPVMGKCIIRCFGAETTSCSGFSLSLSPSLWDSGVGTGREKEKAEETEKELPWSQGAGKGMVWMGAGLDLVSWRRPLGSKTASSRY
ncbi:hypothetical protein LY76DRAFT_324468 [Colletotrichum caudatum]|nr:hypothetical protein LY76DRAFT_324468 [Colletotrichum caudatum]